MIRKDFNLYKSEIRRLLKQIDDSFVPNHVYDEGSKVCLDVLALRFVVNTLYRDLIS